MMWSKDQWFAEYERTLDNYAAGDISRGIARERLGQLGIDRPEAEKIIELEEGSEGTPHK